MQDENLLGTHEGPEVSDRLKTCSFLEIVTLLREDEEDSPESKLERQSYLLKQCKTLCKKTQQALRKNADHFLQMHIGASVTTSIALGLMTSSIYL